MKSLNIVIVSIAFLTTIVSNAVAADLVINPPDINGKLNTLVERKMNTLMEEKSSAQDQRRVSEEAKNAREQHQELTQDTFIYVVSDSRN
jgi:hypothetical protein